MNTSLAIPCSTVTKVKAKVARQPYAWVVKFSDSAVFFYETDKTYRGLSAEAAARQQLEDRPDDEMFPVYRD